MMEKNYYCGPLYKYYTIFSCVPYSMVLEHWYNKDKVCGYLGLLVLSDVSLMYQFRYHHLYHLCFLTSMHYKLVIPN